MPERIYKIALSTFPGFGSKRLTLLLNYFKSAHNLWHAGINEILSTGMRAELITEFVKHRNYFDIESYLKKLELFKIRPVLLNDKEYPENLRQISDPPHVLYIRGSLTKSDTRSVAIVGTRMMTGYGKQVAEKFSGQLASFGITIVSGLALGIDAAAQNAALSVGGRTISVLASGLNIITPLANKKLAESFIGGNGAIVSEYPLGHIPRNFDFPVRDRLISGMAKAVIVVEGRMKSGTFYTVKAAADQGRPVFAVPGPITSRSSDGPNYLLQNGAKVLLNVKDVLDELDVQFKVDPELVNSVLPEDGIETLLYKILNKEPLHLDEVVRISHEPTSEVSARLTIMEMKGLVVNLGGGVYKNI